MYARWYTENLVGIAIGHQDTGHVPETGAGGTATIALTWVLSIAYIINACECAGARHGIRGAVRGASRGWLRSTSTPPRPRARRVKGKRGTARSGLRAHCSRPPNKPHTERYWSLVSSPENDPTTNRSRKREDDCPQSLNSPTKFMVFVLLIFALFFKISWMLTISFNYIFTLHFYFDKQIN